MMMSPMSVFVCATAYVATSVFLLLLNRKWVWVYDNPVTAIMLDATGFKYCSLSNEMQENPGLLASLVLFGPVVTAIVLIAIIAFFCVLIALGLTITLPTRVVNWTTKKS